MQIELGWEKNLRRGRIVEHEEHKSSQEAGRVQFYREDSNTFHFQSRRAFGSSGNLA